MIHYAEISTAAAGPPRRRSYPGGEWRRSLVPPPSPGPPLQSPLAGGGGGPGEGRVRGPWPPPPIPLFQPGGCPWLTSPRFGGFIIILPRCRTSPRW
uniref:Uncharacterized protein n=1 Tax=Desulfobacca acetoxidans TaxID=60893 RepID=A0A7V4GA44_9BACT